MFISHREQRLLKSIERTTKQTIAPMQIPSISELNETRLSKFKQSVMNATRDDSLETLMPIVEMLKEESETSPEILMAALMSLAQGEEPLILKESDRPNLDARPPRERREYDNSDRGPRRGEEKVAVVKCVLPKPVCNALE